MSDHQVFAIAIAIFGGIFGASVLIVLVLSDIYGVLKEIRDELRKP